MSPRSLPASPSLDHLKSDAKALLSALRAGVQTADCRFQDSHPRAADGSKGAFVLADAQLVVAREHGFESWPRLKRRVEHGLAQRSEDRRPLPRSFRVAFLTEMAEALLAAPWTGEWTR